MRLSRILTLGFAATVLSLGGPPASGDLLGDGDSTQDIDLFGHSLSGECHWAGPSTDRGTVAEFYGYGHSDADGAGITIECWLRYAGTKNRVPNTTMRAGAPGSTVAVRREITVPTTLTFVCMKLDALYIDGASKTYTTRGCV